jgi:hypothetical protein
LLDFIRMSELKTLSLNLNYLDRSENHESAKEVENLLKSTIINTIVLGEG